MLYSGLAIWFGAVPDLAPVALLSWLAEKTFADVTRAAVTSAYRWCSPSASVPRATRLVLSTGCCRVAATPVSKVQAYL